MNLPALKSSRSEAGSRGTGRAVQNDASSKVRIHRDGLRQVIGYMDRADLFPAEAPRSPGCLRARKGDRVEYMQRFWITCSRSTRRQYNTAFTG